jgi:hypothetical protein
MEDAVSHGETHLRPEGLHSLRGFFFVEFCPVGESSSTGFLMLEFSVWVGDSFCESV